MAVAFRWSRADQNARGADIPSDGTVHTTTVVAPPEAIDVATSGTGARCGRDRATGRGMPKRSPRRALVTRMSGVA
jgi:hypothetical protein